MSHKVAREDVEQSKSVGDLKKLLVSHGHLHFLHDDFYLAHLMESPEKMEAKKDILEEEDLPLHYYGVRHEDTLRVETPFVVITMEDPSGKKQYDRFKKDDTIEVVKKRYREIFGEKMKGVKALHAFVDSDDGYRKVKDNWSLRDVLPDDKCVYFLHDTNYAAEKTVSQDWQAVGTVRVDFAYTDDSGIRLGGDTVRTIKLRILEEMGIPTKHVTVTRKVDTLGDAHGFTADASIDISSKKSV